MSAGIAGRTDSSAVPSRRQSALLMAIGTLTSRLFGVMRLIALAYALGTNSLSDAFNLANNTPNTIYDLLLGGVLASTIVPVFTARFATSAQEEGWRSVSAVLTIATAGLIVATIGFEAVSSFIIDLYTVANHHGFAADQRILAVRFLRIFAPQLFFYGFITIITAVLNSRNHFSLPAFAPIVNNVIAIGSLLTFAHFYKHPNVESVLANPAALWLIALGTTLGVVAQAAAILPALFRLKIKLKPVWDTHDPAVTEIFKMSGWTFSYVALNQIAVFVILAIADPHPGVVSAYSYAYLFFQLPYAIASLAVMSTVQPELSKRWAMGDVSGFSSRLTSALRASVAVTIPPAIGYLALGNLAVLLILGYGATTASETLLATHALYGFALGLPGFAAFLSMVQALQAMKHAKAVFVIYAVENIANIVFAFLLEDLFGTTGLSSALAIAYTMGAIIGFLVLSASGVELDPWGLVRIWTRNVVISVVAGVVVKILSLRLGSHHGFSLFFEVLLLVGVGALCFISLTALGTRLWDRGKGSNTWQRSR